MKDLFTKRKIRSNFWVIRTRWYTTSGLLLIGILANSLGVFDFPYYLSLGIAAGMYIINYLFYLLAKYSREKSNLVISYLQIAFDILLISAIFYLAGALESVVFIFYFLPITTASALFGHRGPIITAMVSSFSVAFIVGLEYAEIIPHFYRYDIITHEYANHTVGITKINTICIIFMMIGFYLGYISKMLRSQEKSLTSKNAELEVSSHKIKRAYLELSKTKNELAEEHERVAAVINNFIDPIVVIGAGNKINLVNPAAEKILGLNKSHFKVELNPRSNYSLLNFRTLIPFDYKVKTASELKGEDNTEEIIITHSGQETTYKVTTLQIFDVSEKKFNTMKIFYNFTREKMIERLKSEFISIAAHQLRTPLSAVKWAIRMVMDGDEGKISSKQKETLMKGYLSNERMIKLVNDMLNVSRIEEGRFGYDFDLWSIELPLEAALDKLNEQIKSKKIKVKIEMYEKVSLINMDKEKIAMALENILENSVEYTPVNGQISIKAKNMPGALELRIKDNGVGVPVNEQKKLFSKFFRASNVIRMKTEGSGLGLFISKNIIKKHHGTIKCESQEGMGTKFIITLPVRAA